MGEKLSGMEWQIIQTDASTRGWRAYCNQGDMVKVGKTVPYQCFRNVSNEIFSPDLHKGKLNQASHFPIGKTKQLYLISLKGFWSSESTWPKFYNKTMVSKEQTFHNSVYSAI